MRGQMFKVELSGDAPQTVVEVASHCQTTHECTKPRRRLLEPDVRPLSHWPISGIDRQRQIFPASLSEISLCLGTASTAPVSGLHHKEWDFPFTLQIATVPPHVTEEVAGLHFTVTLSRTALLGNPRSPSSRRSSRIRAMASDRL